MNKIANNYLYEKVFPCESEGLEINKVIVNEVENVLFMSVSHCKSIPIAFCICPLDVPSILNSSKLSFIWFCMVSDRSFILFYDGRVLAAISVISIRFLYGNHVYQLMH